VTALDPGRNQWTAERYLPRRVWQACGAASGNRFYVMGGRDSADGPAVNTMDVLGHRFRSLVVVGGAAGGSGRGGLRVRERAHLCHGRVGQCHDRRTPSGQAWEYDPAALGRYFVQSRGTGD